MKHFALLIGLLAVLAMPALQAAGGPDVADLVGQGMAALERGDLATAESLATQALRAAPNHVPARDLMDRVRQGKTAVAKRAAKAVLARTVIDEVDFRDVPLSDAVEALRRKLAAAQTGINLVILDPGNKIRSSPVNDVRLKAAPATEVLEYVAAAVGAEVVYRETSAVVRPKP